MFTLQAQVPKSNCPRDTDMIFLMINVHKQNQIAYVVLLGLFHF